MALGNWNAILGDEERREERVRRGEGGEKRGRQEKRRNGEEKGGIVRSLFMLTGKE